MRRRAVITGLGPITAVGIGRDHFWRGLRAEKSAAERDEKRESEPNHVPRIIDSDSAQHFSS